LKPLGNQKPESQALSSSLKLSSSSIFSSTNLPPRFIAAKKLYSKQILDIGGKDTTRKGGKKKHKKKKKKIERRKSSFQNICTLFLLAHLSGAKASTKQQRFPCFLAMEVVKLL
jgi:hypothetical protein